MTTFQSTDFTLFPQTRSKMLAEARVKQPYFDMTMDPGNIFSYPVDNMAQYGQNDLSRLSQSYYDTSLFESAELHKVTHFASMPTTPPSVSASHSTEPHIPTGSAASGPSIASASSSAMGSPYSGNAHTLHDNWMNTNHGLGLPAAVMNDMFSHDYMGNAVDMDMLYQEKFSDTFVGMFGSQLGKRLHMLTETRSLIDSTGAIGLWRYPNYRLSRTAYLFLLQCATKLPGSLSCHLTHSL
jgi:hypothetical protein